LLALGVMVRGKGFQFEDNTRTNFLNRAIAAKDYNAAADIAGRNGTLNVVNGDFSSDPSKSPFDWRLQSNVSRRAERVENDKDRGRFVLQLYSATGAAGTLTQQLLILNPGRYVLRGKVRRIKGSLPYVSITCADGTGQNVAKADLPAAGEQWRIFGMSFVVAGPGCSAQTLTVASRATDSPNGSAAQIGRISIDSLTSTKN